MFHWKWTHGEKYEKTSKEERNKKHILNEILFQVENKREEMVAKLSEREMFAQIGLNPFSQNSYENDIANYDKHMKSIK
jgi:hypothetical protein